MVKIALRQGSKGRNSVMEPADVAHLSAGLIAAGFTYTVIFFYCWGNIIKNKISQPRKPLHKGNKKSLIIE